MKDPASHIPRCCGTHPATGLVAVVVVAVAVVVAVVVAPCKPSVNLVTA